MPTTKTPVDKRRREIRVDINCLSILGWFGIAVRIVMSKEETIFFPPVATNIFIYTGGNSSAAL
jgi:hypothetical protein